MARSAESKSNTAIDELLCNLRHNHNAMYREHSIYSAAIKTIERLRDDAGDAEARRRELKDIPQCKECSENPFLSRVTLISADLQEGTVTLKMPDAWHGEVHAGTVLVGRMILPPL